MASGKRSVVILSVPDAERGELRAFVMAAAVLGVRLREKNSFVEYRRLDEHQKEVRAVTWALEQRSECGKYLTAEMWRWWRDAVWRAENPDHPLCRFWEYWRALQDAAAHEKSAVVLATFTRRIAGGKRHLRLPVNRKIDPERKRKLMEAYEK